MLTRGARLAYLAPGLLWLGALLVVPCAILLVNSFFLRGVYGGIDYIWTVENYTRAADWLYLSIFLKSAKIAGLATLFAILIAYPAAWAIAQAPRRRQAALLVLVILPFWSNYLIRTYAWMVLLNREGLINEGLEAVGLIGEPLTLLNTEFAIVLGLVYNYLPFVILTIYAALARLDRSLIEASQDLGAPGWRTFLRVVLPLTLPGVAAGGVFVFVLSIGNFITPDLLGGQKIQMVGNLIYDQFLSARDWPFGAALATVLIMVMMMLLFAQAIAVNRGAGRREAREARP